MRGSHRRSRRHRRLVSTTFTVTGLVLSIFLMFGPLGLIVASADDRGRDGSFESDTDVISNDSDSRSSGGGAGGSSIKARDDNAIGRERNLGTRIPITNNQVGALEGLIAGGDPSDEGDWTPGNLCQGNGPCYHELDNVPHRILLDGLTTGTEYSFTILIDAQDNAGHFGYDDLGNVVAISGVVGTPVVVQNANTTTGCGQSTTCESYTFTFTASDDEAEIRFTAHLAIGSHLFGGSSLSVRLLGSARNVPLPVGDILLDIRAHKFNDLNGNGTQDAGEPALSGWTMTLFSGTTCSGQPVNVTGNANTDPNPGTTDSNGDVVWTNLSASDGDSQGRFSVRETLQAGWTNTTPLCREVTVVGLENLAIFGNQQLQPNLAITKTGAATVDANSNITWTITVSNTGNVAATNVKVTDTLPAGFTFVSSNPDGTGSPGTPPFCTHSAGVVSCSLGTIAAAGSAQITITATAPNTCGPFTNTASGTFGIGNTPISGSPATASGDVTGCAANVSIAKSGAATVNAGANITWTITVSNTGNAAATNVKVTDTLPVGFTFVSSNPDASGSPGTPPFCTHSAGVVSCSLGTIAAAGSAQITITATAPNACDPFVNSATGTFGPNDTPMTGSPATARGDVVGCAASVSIAKTGASTVAAGANITWTITVSNTGNAAATNVLVSDTLPAGFTFVSSTPDNTTNPTPPFCSHSAGVVSCSLGTIAAAGSAQITITATAPNTCGPFTNTASGTFGIGNTPMTGSPATATGDVTGCAPALTITKTPASQTVAAGSQVVWTVTVTNNGNAPASQVSVTDTLPAGFTFVSANPAICTGTTTLTCVFPGPIAGGGGTASVAITVQSPNTCATFTNTVNFTGATTTPATANVTLTGCAPPGSPALSVTKTADAAVVTPPSPIGFTITVSNTGSADANNVTLSDTIPAVPGVTWSINGGTGAAQCSLTGNLLSCSFGTLSAGSSRSVHIISTATSSASCGTFTNVAVASSSNAGTATGQATVEVDCPPGNPSIRIVKEANPDSGSPGEVITYVYRITNTGDVTLFDISVDDDIVGHICDIPELDPGESVKCTADYTIPEDANIEITNVVIAVGEDENGTEVSDEDEETILVILGTTVTPTPTVTPPGGVAFTGTGAFLPLAGLALLMLTLGTGLLWWGRRRGSHERDMFQA
jgi:uncharacterized repeat protein (TIGR01451 family)